MQGTGQTVAAAGDTCNGAAADTTLGFLATGNPTVDGGSGVRAFGVDSSAVLRSTTAAAGITNVASYLASPILE